MSPTSTNKKDKKSKANSPKGTGNPNGRRSGKNKAIDRAVTKQRYRRILEKKLSGESTITEAAVEEGFSKNYAESGQLTATKGWQELLEEAIPDEKLVTVMNEGLGSIGKVGEVDYSTRHKYLKTALEVKNKMPTGQSESERELLRGMSRIFSTATMIREDTKNEPITYTGDVTDVEEDTEEAPQKAPDTADRFLQLLESNNNDTHE